jgi:hypothetical protein|tara:strand:+ start:1295 stop:1549 length:255 start_codon:yes stop_codon:yes gene_type:complete
VFGCTVEKVTITDLLMIVLFVSATDDRILVLVVLAADVCDDPNINGGSLPISISFGADCTVEDTAKCAPNDLSGGFGMIKETKR